jgi:hypothetical protein
MSAPSNIPVFPLPSKMFSDSPDNDLSVIVQTIYFNNNSVNLPYLLDQCLKKCHLSNPSPSEKKKYYMRLYRFLISPKCQETYDVHKSSDGLLWVAIAPKALDLFRQVQNSNSQDAVPNSMYALPNRCRPERIEAIKQSLRSKMLTSSQSSAIQGKFSEYLNVIDHKKIILIRDPEGYSSDPEALILDYETRFNSPKKQVKSLENYESVWDTAGVKYKTAVHLVLTTDPKRFKSLWHGWKHFSKAFNRFMSFLRKIKKERPKYLAVYEFTKSGLMHVHCVIFGMSSLMHKNRITAEWERCGQGSYNFIYSLRNENGKWVYARGQPREVKKGESVDNYLKKYLKKSFYHPELLGMYWISNKRFFTCSRVFSAAFTKPPPARGVFIFFTCVDESGIYDALHEDFTKILSGRIRQMGPKTPLARI